MHALLFLLAFALLSCGKKEQKLPPQPGFSVGNIKMDSRVPAQQRAEITSAYHSLDGEPMRLAEPELLQYLRSTNASAGTMRRWLEDRVQYILPDSSDFESFFSVTRTRYNYENPGEIPPELNNPRLAEKGSVVMRNLGASIYAYGKKHGLLVYGDVSGFGQIPLTSPRVGMLQVGEGFSRVVEGLSPFVSQAFHLSTLLHEGRHSDGRGRGVGFFHAKCPSGDYKDKPACDAVANGPYKLDALIMKSHLRSCQSCSAGEREDMKLIYLDAESRVLPGSAARDDAPEGHR